MTLRRDLGPFAITAIRMRFNTILLRLHRDEIGAEEGMNKLLIFAMVALPLLALLIFFGGQIVDFAQQQWDTVFGGGGVPVK